MPASEFNFVNWYLSFRIALRHRASAVPRQKNIRTEIYLLRFGSALMLLTSTVSTIGNWRTALVDIEQIVNVWQCFKHTDPLNSLISTNRGGGREFCRFYCIRSLCDTPRLQATLAVSSPTFIFHYSMKPKNRIGSLLNIRKNTTTARHHVEDFVYRAWEREKCIGRFINGGIWTLQLWSFAY